MRSYFQFSNVYSEKQKEKQIFNDIFFVFCRNYYHISQNHIFTSKDDFHGLFGGITIPVRDSHFQNKPYRPFLICHFSLKSFHLQLHLLKARLLPFMLWNINAKGKKKKKKGRENKAWKLINKTMEVFDKGLAPVFCFAL